MKINLTPSDRSLRAVLGFALIASPIMGFDSMPYNWLGLIPWATAVFGFSPLYHVLGFTTCSPTSYRYDLDGVQLPETTTHAREAHV